jgi:hypothetical protein
VPDLTFAVSATVGLEVMLEAVVDQRGDRRVGLENDAPATAAVATVRTALGDMRLTTERHAAGTAVTGFDVYLYLVDEHVWSLASLGARTPILYEQTPRTGKGAGGSRRLTCE